MGGQQWQQAQLRGGEGAEYDSARTWAKHAGICPRDDIPAAYLAGQRP